MQLLRRFFSALNILLSVMLMAALIAGCFEWTEDSQGNLKSVGLPGVPVWRASPSSAATPNGELSLARATPDDPAFAELIADGTGNGLWLVELNKWREATGLEAVGENTDLSHGSANHARYLVEQGPHDGPGFVAYIASIGAAAHAEDRGSKWYTPEGAEAAGGGKPTPGVARTAIVTFDRTEQEDIQKLLVVPFHRFSLLAPWAQVAGYGAYGTYPLRAAALALRGTALVKPPAPKSPVMFPPDGSSFAIRQMVDHEWPDPLASCPGYKLPGGLPITVQSWKLIKVTAYSLRDATDDRAVEACAVDALNYANPDAVAQRRGRAVLGFNGAVIILPRHPLEPGHRYTVEIKTLHHAYGWTFAIGLHPIAAAESASR
jgi:hypothetical protein